jgi:hypothetical protein
VGFAVKFLMLKCFNSSCQGEQCLVRLMPSITVLHVDFSSSEKMCHCHNHSVSKCVGRCFVSLISLNALMLIHLKTPHCKSLKRSMMCIWMSAVVYVMSPFIFPNRMFCPHTDTEDGRYILCSPSFLH